MYHLVQMLTVGEAMGENMGNFSRVTPTEITLGGRTHQNQIIKKQFPAAGLISVGFILYEDSPASKCKVSEGLFTTQEK